MPANRFKPQLRQPRVAEMVAEVLRSRILSGVLRDGDLIGKQDELLDEFKVSKPSIRESLRILETEGLCSVQRGGIGGAVVHAPRAEDAGYSLALVLESRHVNLSEIGATLKRLEPVCAAMCASRPDRHEAVVPALREANEAAKRHISDVYELAMAGRRFHELLVERCGSDTMIVLVGALESLWTAHQAKWAERVVREDQAVDPGDGLATLRMHDQLLELIEQGDADQAAQLARAHLEDSLLYRISESEQQPVRASTLRRAPMV